MIVGNHEIITFRYIEKGEYVEQEYYIINGDSTIGPAFGRIIEIAEYKAAILYFRLKHKHKIVWQLIHDMQYEEEEAL